MKDGAVRRPIRVVTRITRLSVPEQGWKVFLLSGVIFSVPFLRGSGFGPTRVVPRKSATFVPTGGIAGFFIL